MRAWAEGRSAAIVRNISSKGSQVWRCQSGATAAEFALSVMLLVIILFGIITFGWMFYIENNMESAAREGARRMAAEEVTYAGANVSCADAQAQTLATAEGVVCSMLPNWGGDITVNASDLCATGDPTVRVQVSVDGEDAALADIFGFFNGATVSSTAEWYLAC